MKWPPNKAWTSLKKLKGYRHFEVINFGGKGEGRWVELCPLQKKQTRIQVTWSQLKDKTSWQSGWKQLPQEGNHSDSKDISANFYKKTNDG